MFLIILFMIMLFFILFIQLFIYLFLFSYNCLHFLIFIRVEFGKTDSNQEFLNYPTIIEGFSGTTWGHSWVSINQTGHITFSNASLALYDP